MLMSIVFNLASIAMLAIPAQGTVFNWLLSAAAAIITVIMICFYENKNKRSQLDALQEPSYQLPNSKLSLSSIALK
jgi:hypothetical protein